MAILAAQRREADDDMPRPHMFDVAGETLTADPLGALYLERERCLIVADLHLEKGSSMAGRGVFLPPYDTAATLAKLALLVTRHAPRAVICLGDSFHDRQADTRIGTDDVEALQALQAGQS